jgi:hypothetical protein
MGWILLKAQLKLDIFDKFISGSKVDFIFQNARCKERMRKLCVFRDGIYPPRLFLPWLPWLHSLPWLPWSSWLPWLPNTA